MGLFMLPIGMWAAANPMGVLVLAFGLSNINLQGHYMPYDFAFFLEVGFASLIGMYVAFLGASLFRQWGVSHQVHRFLCRERSEEQTSELQSLMRLSYAVFCLKNKKK